MWRINNKSNNTYQFNSLIWQAKIKWLVTYEASQCIHSLIYPFTGPATNHCPENGLGHLRAMEYPNVHIISPQVVALLFMRTSIYSQLTSTTNEFQHGALGRICSSYGNLFGPISDRIMSMVIFFPSFLFFIYFLILLLYWSTCITHDGSFQSSDIVCLKLPSFQQILFYKIYVNF